jgi:DNA-binding transcriptional LysR family regulator
MRSQIDLKRMRYIVEVARAEAITTAAKSLSITQPALTRNIAEVEEELGIQIFCRLPRGIELTEEGKEFVTRAKQILGEVDTLISEMSENTGAQTGRLKIGVAPTGNVDYVRSAVQALVVDYPDVSVEIIGGSARTICPRLILGELHLVVAHSGYLEQWRELQVRRLIPLELAMMMRKGHPLAGVNDVKEVDVLQYPMILPASVEPVHSVIEKRYAANNLPPLQPRYVTDDWDMVDRLVKKTDAITPHLHVESVIKARSKSYFMLRDVVKIPTPYVSLAHSPMRPKTRLAELFESLLVESLQ